MMALANLLHRASIGPDLIAGTQTKRSNKDFWPVLALGWLTSERDRRDCTEELGEWAPRMGNALRARFPGVGVPCYTACLKADLHVHARRLLLGGSVVRKLINEWQQTVWTG